MKKFIAVSVLMCACGNWSNEDIVYLYALPEKDVLKSQLGAMDSTGQGVRRDPLLGEDAGHYASTKKGSDEFNAFLDLVLGGLDALRSIHPTKREDNKRIWGPYPDDKNPGFDIRVEIVKVTERHFKWSIGARKRGNEVFTTIGGGKFVPTASLKEGRGDFFFDGVAARNLYGRMKNAGDPDRIDVGYWTDSDPVIVEAAVDFGPMTMFGYDYNGYVDQSAVLTFTVGGLGDPDATKISALAAWNPKTAGEVVYSILEGNNRGAMARQCWNEDQKIVHELLMLPDGGVYQAGNDADCVTVPVLKPLPPFPNP